MATKLLSVKPPRTTHQREKINLWAWEFGTLFIVMNYWLKSWSSSLILTRHSKFIGEIMHENAMEGLMNHTGMLKIVALISVRSGHPEIITITSCTFIPLFFCFVLESPNTTISKSRDLIPYDCLRFRWFLKKKTTTIEHSIIGSKN